MERDPLGSYPGNSHKARQEKKEPKQLTKITTGKVATRKKSLYKRFMDTFVVDDISNVVHYIIHDVLVPAAKSTVADMVQGGTDMILFPGRGNSGSRGRREQGRSYVSYDRNRNTNQRNQRDDRSRDISPKNRARHNFDELIIDSRAEADEVISTLVDLTLDYDQATVSDLYALVGTPHTSTDTRWGWTDLSSASASPLRGGGYVLNLPKPIFLD